MKRFLIFISCVLLLAGIFSLVVCAEEEAAPSTEIELPDSFWGWLNFGLDDLKQYCYDRLQDFTANFSHLDDGGLALGANDRTNNAIAAIYRITYPLGLGILLVSWGFGVFKAGITSALDMKERNSLVRSVLDLIIGLCALSVAPQAMTVILGLSANLCEVINQIWVDATPTGQTAAGWAVVIVGLIVGLVLGLNTLWLATLQAISPIFIGCFGGSSSKKIGLNFVKEYLKAALIPVITVIYYKLMITIVGQYISNLIVILEIIIGLVFGISVLGVAGKKLDKLIN